MKCKDCQEKLKDADRFCPRCGVPTPPRTSSDATISLVLGIIGFLVVPFVLSVLAMIYGQRAYENVKKHRDFLSGEPIALAGLILGFIGFFGWVAFTIRIVSALFQ